MNFGSAKGASSLYGAAAVYRQRRRNRPRYRQAIAASIVFVSVIVLAALLRQLLLGDAPVQNGAMATVARQWLSPMAIASTILLMASAAILGAEAAPVNLRQEEIQSAVMAGLSPFAIVTGRLMAAFQVPAL